MAERTQVIRANKYTVTKWLIEFNEKKLKDRKPRFFTKEEFLVWLWRKVGHGISFESILRIMRDLRRMKILRDVPKDKYQMNKGAIVKRKMYYLDVYQAKHYLKKYEMKMMKQKIAEDMRKKAEDLAMTIERFLEL